MITDYLMSLTQEQYNNLSTSILWVIGLIFLAVVASSMNKVYKNKDSTWELYGLGFIFILFIFKAYLIDEYASGMNEIINHPQVVVGRNFEMTIYPTPVIIKGSPESLITQIKMKTKIFKVDCANLTLKDCSERNRESWISMAQNLPPEFSGE